MEKEKYIDTLLERFMLGQTTEQEEDFLAQFFRTAGKVPGKWEEYARMFEVLETGALAFSDKDLDAMLVPQAAVRRPMRSVVRRVAAACAVAVVVAVVAVIFAPGTQPDVAVVVPKPAPAPSVPMTPPTVTPASPCPSQPRRQAEKPALTPPAAQLAAAGQAEKVLREETLPEEMLASLVATVMDADAGLPASEPKEMRVRQISDIGQVRMECEFSLLEEEYQEYDATYNAIVL